MRAELQTTKTYHVAFDENEVLELIADLSTILPGDNRYALHNLRILLQSLK